MINNYNSENKTLSYFRTQIEKTEHTYRQGKVNTIRRYLLRQHDVSQRMSHSFTYKGKTFIPSVIILQGMKTVVNFHTAYLVGNPVSLTGTENAVKLFNKYYRNGIYGKTDWQILSDLITYGNAFEYVYIDDNGKIKSKVFRNQDSYPIYDDENRYCNFVEYWKDSNSFEHFTIYFPDHVDTYIDNRLVATKYNPSGLPIHYCAMDKSDYDHFGDSMLLDLIPVMDKIEMLLSKLDDAITTLSLNPVGVVTGSKVTENDMVDSNVSGAVLNLAEGETFTYSTAVMDYNCIKFEFDQLYQQFNLIAAVPSSVLGQSNVSNVSENSLSMIYQLTENKGKQNINAITEGFRQRWEYMRKLMSLLGDALSNDDFDSLNVSYNISKPTDTKMNMENMEKQYNMGAISKRTLIELSPYTTDSAQELQRLDDEGVRPTGE